MAKKSTAGSEEGGAEVAAAAPVEALEPEKCTDLAAAIRACDEKGYPVMVDGTVHEKKVWAIAACEKVLGGPGSPVSGASVVVAKPRFK